MAREWLSARVAEVWQARGPYPGLGAALTAFGIGEGVLLAHAIQSQVHDNDDPWQLADRWLRAPSAAAEASDRVSTVMSRTWAGLDDQRRALLRLLSRFDMTIDQATLFYQPTERDKAGLSLSDADLLANPYLIYEHRPPVTRPRRRSGKSTTACSQRTGSRWRTRWPRRPLSRMRSIHDASVP